MSNPITQIPAAPAGNAKEVAWFRQLLRCIDERTIKVGPGLRLSYKKDGVLVEVEPTAKEVTTFGSAITQYKLVSVLDDHLTAREWDGTTLAETEIEIAKPYKLRRTPFDGQTLVFILEDPISGNRQYSIAYTYHSATFRVANITAQSGGNSTQERQVIIPQYRVDDLIYAATVSNGTELDGINLIDINADGRAWSRKQ